MTAVLDSRGFPPLSSRRIRLRTVGEGDRVFLYDLMTSPYAGGNVRFGGATPSPDRVAGSLWESVLAQFVIESHRGEPRGLVAVTSPSFRDGFAYLSVVGRPDVQGSGLVLEGAVLAFHYAFTTWPFRKLYLEANEQSHARFASGAERLFREEGRLRGHVFRAGRYLDVLLLAVYRDTWAREAPLWIPRLCPECVVPGRRNESMKLDGRDSAVPTPG